MPSFRHLHCHGRHSRLDGNGTEEQWVERISELGHDSFAITDHGNLCAFPGLAKVAKGKLKVIWGCEFYLSANLEDKAAEQKALGTTAYPHVTVLAANQAGYANLVRLSTLSNERGFSRYPRIDFEALARHQEGLVVLSGCPGGWPTRLLRSKGEEECAAWLRWFQERVERFYVELDPAPGFTEARPAFGKLLALAQEMHLPCVMTADAHFPKPEHWQAQDALCAVGTGHRRDDPTRPVKMPPDQFACTAVDLYKRALLMFDEPVAKGSPRDEALRAALWRSGEIAASCEPVELPEARPVVYAGLKPGDKDSEVLWEWLLRGLDERQEQGLLPAQGYSRQDYLERATYEWSALKQKGFANYLLIVIDLVRHVKASGGVVLTRGSAGGCLLLWLCGASVTDSLKHELSFERFFDSSRSDPPDVDIDFQEQDRSNALDYLRQQYGADRVAQLAAYGELHAKAAIKDSATALGISNAAAQAVSNVLRGDKDDLLEQLQQAKERDPYVRELLTVRPEWAPLAASLIGQIRNSSIHAAGVLVGSESFDGRLPLMRGKGGQVVAAVDKRGAKQLGYLKIDTLIVDSLDIVGRCLQFLGRPPQWLEELPLDDPEVYRQAAQRLAGVFQLDGTAASYAVRQIGLREFADLAVCGSICRPGAVTHVEHFARCRRDPAYLEQRLAELHPGLAQIVRETCGVLLYQEQVMRLANELAGLPMAEVQLLRKGISDKLGTQPDLAKAAAWREEWRGKVSQGLQRVSGFTEEAAIHLWEVIEAHGGYSFNRSHCYTYAMLGYWMLYLKVHHPREFYRAAMEQEERPLRRKELIRELQRAARGKVRVLDPQVVTVNGDYHWSGLLVGGLSNLAYCGEKSAQKVVAAVEGGVVSWEELLALLPGRTRKLVQRSGIAEGKVKDQAALLVLAPWFPVQQLPQGARDCRARQGLPTSVELEERRGSREVCSISLLGYVTHRDMSPKHAGFTLEDEFGTVDVRVGKKKLSTLGGEVRRLQVGDLVGVVGWWNGDCLYLQSSAVLERFDPKGGFDDE